MGRSEFRKSARFIVRRNVTERVERVLATFEPEGGKLRLVYCTRGMPKDDDVEWCELACAELIAAFPEIREADTQCLPVDACVTENNQDVVFQRTEIVARY